MSNHEDPYAGLIDAMRSQAGKVQPPGWCLGTVVTASPLVIRANGMELDRDDLLVDPRLLEGWEVPCSLQLSLTSGSVTLDIGGKSVETSLMVGDFLISSLPLYELPGTLSGTLAATGTLRQTKGALAPGDRVVLLPDGEGQTYIVLCKVVTPV